MALKRVAVVAALIAAACSHPVYHRVDLTPQELPSGVYQIWSGRSAVNWTHVIITPDSVRGMLEYCTGQSCQRCLPRSAVDSIRGGGKEATAHDSDVVAAVGTLVLIGLLILDGVVGP